MALEDFTTYTEVDPFTAIEIVSATNVVATALPRGVSKSRVLKDYGSGAFSGDFSHTFILDSITIVDDPAGSHHPWAVSEINESWSEAFAGARDMMQITMSINTASNPNWRFAPAASAGGSFKSGSTTTFTWDGSAPLYVTVAFVTTTLTISFHSDAARTVLLEAQSVDVESVLDVGWIHVAHASSSSADQRQTFSTSDLELGLGGGAPRWDRNIYIGTRTVR